jgi:hypothetical protein
MLGDLRGAAPLSGELRAELLALRAGPERGEPYGAARFIATRQAR